MILARGKFPLARGSDGLRRSFRRSGRACQHPTNDVPNIPRAHPRMGGHRNHAPDPGPTVPNLPFEPSLSLRVALVLRSDVPKRGPNEFPVDSVASEAGVGFRDAHPSRLPGSMSTANHPDHQRTDNQASKTAPPQSQQSPQPPTHHCAPFPAGLAGEELEIGAGAC
jgi:hypothetical protein